MKSDGFVIICSNCEIEIEKDRANIVVKDFCSRGGATSPSSGGLVVQAVSSCLDHIV